jgi:hypothetical protein
VFVSAGHFQPRMIYAGKDDKSGSDGHSSLLQYSISYGSKKFMIEALVSCTVKNFNGGNKCRVVLSYEYLLSTQLSL